jgi:4-amino-4-deoxy-L-arabinose transferase-like glycosyltransferase
LRTLSPSPPPTIPRLAAPAPPARRRFSPALIDGGAVVLILLYLGLMLSSLDNWPPLNNDEGREANLSWVASGLEPGAERMNAYRGYPTWGTGGLQGATTVGLFHLFGLGVFQARLTSLLWAGLLLGVVYWLGRHWWGRPVGLAALALLAVSDPLLLSSHILRPDIQVITLVMLALALVEYSLDRGRGWPPVLAGVLLGLSFDTHMNTAGLLPVVAAAPLTRYGWRVWRQPAVWQLAGGIGLAAIYYAAVRIVPDPSGYFTAFRYWVGVDKAPPLTRGESGGLLGQLQAEALRYADYFGLSPGGLEEPGELLLIAFGLGFGLWRALRGARPERVLLLGLLGVQLFFILLVSTKSRYYMLLTYPQLLLLVAAGLWWIASRLPIRAADNRLAYAALAGLVLFCASFPLKTEERAWDKFVRASRYRAGQDYYALTARLEELAGPEARILAPPLYWFGLQGHEFVDIFVYERVKRQHGQTAEEFLAAIRPDFVIADGNIATSKQLERELYRALDQRARYELIVRHKNYGDVAIYRLNWD